MTPSPHSERPAGPDAIWAPWRLTYLESIDQAPAQTPAASPAGFLERYFAQPEKDVEHHVLHRTDGGMILLNGFPYANGHLLVALGEGRPRLLDYSPGQRAHLWELVDVATDLLERTLQPQGVNIGVNQGRAAGAGVPGHLHVHLVPRWSGDVNFITTIGQVRVIPSSLDAMAERYRRTIAQVRSGGGPG